MTSAPEKAPVTWISVPSFGDGSRVETRASTPVTKITAFPAQRGDGGDGSRVLKSKTKVVVKGNARPMLRNWDIDERQRDIHCTQHGGTENLKIRQYADIPMPEAPDHVVVKVMQSTVSSEDCLARTKGDPNTAPHPPVPGHCIVGRIHSIGIACSSKFRVGGRIAALLPEGGGNAKYASLPKRKAILLPEGAYHEDIVCLVSSYVAAHQCLRRARKDGAPLTDANVLVVGGSGPVGQAVVELALREGARVYATAHRRHAEYLTRVGARWLSAEPRKWLPHLQGRMDVVIDNLCVDGCESSYEALTPDGILVCNTGNRSEHLIQQKKDPEHGDDTRRSGVEAPYASDRVIIYNVMESYEADRKMFARDLQYLVSKLQRGEISPKVAGKVGFNQVPKAQALIEKGLPNGTVVCLPWKLLDPEQEIKAKAPVLAVENEQSMRPQQ